MTPLCKKCGNACYVCPECNAEFICSCDEPEHNCSKKEIKGVAGNPFGLYCAILNLKEVFDGNASLGIDDDGRPNLHGWHILKEGGEREENDFCYMDNEWICLCPDPTDFNDDLSGLVDLAESGDYLEYED